jgi:O-antigen/teichoic acid export membrane protein
VTAAEAGTARPSSRLRDPVVGLAAGTIVLGGCNYVYLALVGNLVGGVAGAPVSVLWTMMAGLAVGLFQPVEQLLSRGMAADRAAGGTGRAVLGRAAVLGGVLLALALLGLAVASGPVARLLFSGDRAFVLLLAVGLVASTALFFVRGWLAGTGRFGWYAAEMTLEGVVKLGLLAVVAAAGSRDTVALGTSLVVAPLLAAAAVAVGAVARRSRRAAPVLDPSDAATAPSTRVAGGLAVDVRAFAALTTGSLLLQAFVNAGVLLAQGSVAGESTAYTASLVAALAIARVPLFLFNAVQSLLLTRFTVEVQRRRFRPLVRAVAAWDAAVLGLGVAWVVIVWAAGAWLLSLFGDDFELQRGQLVLLAVSCVLQIVTMVTAQALLALGSERLAVAVWPVGLVVLAVTYLGPWGDVGWAVATAMVTGTLATSLAAAACLWWSLRRASGTGAAAGHGAVPTGPSLEQP